MTVEAPARRIYSEAEIAGAVLAVKANRGYVKPVADRMGLHSQTLGRWVSGRRRAGGAASRALMVQKQEQELLQGYLKSALLAQELAMSPEKLAKASAYQLTLMAGIDYDKYLLGTGRPTSRSEALSIRYAGGQDLRAQAATVIDITPTAGPLRPTNISQNVYSTPVTQAQSLGISPPPRKRRIKKAVHAPSGQVMQPAEAVPTSADPGETTPQRRQGGRRRAGA